MYNLIVIYFVFTVASYSQLTSAKEMTNQGFNENKKGSECNLEVTSISPVPANILAGHAFDFFEFEIVNNSTSMCNETVTADIYIGKDDALFSCELQSHCFKIFSSEFLVNLEAGQSTVVRYENSPTIPFNAFNGHGNSVANDDPLAFRTTSILVLGHYFPDAINIFNNVHPSKPELSFPINGSFANVDTTVEWFHSNDPNGEVVNYEVMLRKASSGLVLSEENVCNTLDNVCSLTDLNLQHNSIYYWTVTAFDEAENDSGTNDQFYFVTDAPPAEIYYSGFDGSDQRLIFNYLKDSGFEEKMWRYLFFFGDPFNPYCSISDCSNDPDGEPHTGENWVKFDDDNDTVYQDNVYLPFGSATLTFWLKIPKNKGTGILFAKIDDTPVFLASSIDSPNFPIYQKVTVDVSPFADGLKHTLRFEVENLMNGMEFYLDDVELKVDVMNFKN